MPILLSDSKTALAEIDPGLEYLESQRSWSNRQALFLTQVEKFFAETARSKLPLERTKTYRLAETLDLDPDFEKLNVPLFDVLASRKTHRIADALPIDFRELSTLLMAAYGLQKRLRPPHADDTTPHRTTPSPGGLYPSEIYFLAINVRALAKGIYHYNPENAVLEKIPFHWDTELLNRLVMSPQSAEALQEAAGMILVTSVFSRLRPKYGNRYLRFALLEVGCICQNLDLVANAMGLALHHNGAVDEYASRQLLEIDGQQETVLYSAILSGKLPS